MLPIRRCVHTRTLQVIQCRQWGIRSLSGEALEKTKYFDHHIEHGGKMVPFAGYELPVQYKGTGVLKEHLHTRAEDCASVFDVGHMGQIKWHGKDSVTFLEKMVCGDIGSLKPSEGKLSLIMNEAGGIMDDCVISNAGEYIYMVVNGACKYKDMDHFNHYLQGSGLDVSMEYMHDQQLLALQGPGAARVLSELSPDLNVIAMNFMTTTVATVGGVSDCRVTRCGYTGEDGFELSVDAENAHALMDALQKQNNVQLAGLGARDSLRLEAGLCLYGNDIDEKTNPIEAGLTWTIGGPKSRRRVEQGFLGAEKFLEPSGKLVKQPRKPMGYVQTDFAKEGTEIMLSVRGKMVSAVVTSMPFVPCHYYRAP
eukprot:GSChrysophyteH1.ASY1.ANO1.2793.1 assembled CDS